MWIFWPLALLVGWLGGCASSQPAPSHVAEPIPAINLLELPHGKIIYSWTNDVISVPDCGDQMPTINMPDCGDKIGVEYPPK